MAGRRPKPTQLKILEGNAGHRPLNDSEPETDLIDTTTPAPEWLSPIAAECWERLVSDLADSGIIQISDQLALERACELYAAIRDLQDQIDQSGRTYTVTRDGQTLIKINPLVADLRATDLAFRQYLVEFGLTPASRSRLSVDKKGPDSDPLDRFL